MNKIRVIDLLNKIANDEVPAKIKYKNTIYEYKNIGFETGYVNEYGYEKHWFTNCIDIDDKYKLNDEVEILDNEDEEKKIPEKIDIYVEDDEKWIQTYNYDTILLDKKALSHEELVVIKTLNQIIDYLKSKGE